MKTSDNGIQQIVKFEGFRLKVYRDSANFDTIGVGHLITSDEHKSGTISIDGIPIPYQSGLTKAQVDKLLRQDLVHTEDTVNHLVTVPLSQAQFDTLVSFVFNVGPSNFAASTLLRLLNEGKYDKVGWIDDKGVAQGQLIRWNKAGGKVTSGLSIRRSRETFIWAKGLYS